MENENNYYSLNILLLLQLLHLSAIKLTNLTMKYNSMIVDSRKGFLLRQL